MFRLLASASTALWGSPLTGTAIVLGGVLLLKLIVPPLWEDLKKAADKNKYIILAALLAVAVVGAAAWYIGVLPFILNSGWYFAYSGTDNAMLAALSGLGVVTSYARAIIHGYELYDLVQHGKLADLFSYSAFDQVVSEYKNLTGQDANLGLYGKLPSVADMSRPYLPAWWMVAVIDFIAKSTPVIPGIVAVTLYKATPGINRLPQLAALAMSFFAVATTCLRNTSPIWNELDTIKKILEASTVEATNYLDAQKKWSVIKVDLAEARKLQDLHDTIIQKIAGLEQFMAPKNTDAQHTDRAVEQVLIVKAVNDSKLGDEDKKKVLAQLIPGTDTGQPKALREAGQNFDAICTALQVNANVKNNVKTRLDDLEKGSVLRAKFVRETLDKITAEQQAKMLQALKQNSNQKS